MCVGACDFDLRATTTRSRAWASMINREIRARGCIGRRKVETSRLHHLSLAETRDRPRDRCLVYGERGNNTIVRANECARAHVNATADYAYLAYPYLLFPSLPPSLSLSLSSYAALPIYVELAMNNGPAECCDLPRVINKDVLVPLTKPRSANLHPALNQYNGGRDFHLRAS